MKRTEITWPEVSGFMRSPNIASDAEVYEIENAAADPDRTVEHAMRDIAPWNGKIVMDLARAPAFTSHGSTWMPRMSSRLSPIPPCACA